MVIVSASLIDILTLKNRKVTAMALWPFVLFRTKRDAEDAVIMNHEKIHHRQQLEMLILPYYLVYFAEYWTAMLYNGFRHEQAYLSVSFEQEAYEHQKDPDYLKSRKILSSFKYLKRKIFRS